MAHHNKQILGLASDSGTKYTLNYIIHKRALGTSIDSSKDMHYLFPVYLVTDDTYYAKLEQNRQLKQGNFTNLSRIFQPAVI